MSEINKAMIWTGVLTFCITVICCHLYYSRLPSKEDVCGMCKHYDEIQTERYMADIEAKRQ